MKRSIMVVVAALAALFLLISWRGFEPGVRAEERRGEKEREREREREFEALQGTWKIIRYEEGGRPIDDGVKRSWIITGRKWAHQEKGDVSGTSRLEIDAADSPRHLDVWEGDVHVISAVYVRAGDFVILCGNRPADDGKGRPAVFETGTPEGGLFMIVCRIEK